jgi:hypothetical protein
VASLLKRARDSGPFVKGEGEAPAEPTLIKIPSEKAPPEAMLVKPQQHTALT